ncbi:MAG: tetratricopeptide repeat protein [Desulfovibrionales bacterium]|nr:tetratricopeptide repeat protein [Desulfovibrionales bacterium]
MVDDVSVSAKLHQYEAAVVDFFSKRGGHALVISDDVTFSSLLRQTLTKQLGIQGTVFTVVNSLDVMKKTARMVFSRHKQVVVFIERVMKRQEMGDIFFAICDTYPDAKIIALTAEVKRDELILLHEHGADNVISKPISMNALIEKIAFTIKPQTNFGQKIEIAKKMITQGAYPQALEAGKSILAEKENSSAGFIIVGDAYRGLKQYDKAQMAYEMASESAPMYLDPMKRLVLLYEETGDLESRIRYLNYLDELSPLNSSRKFQIGEAYLEQGDEALAQEAFEACIRTAAKKSGGTAAELSEKIAEKYLEIDPELSERYLRDALESKGSGLSLQDIKLFTSLGIALRKQGKWREAIAEYMQALQISRSDATIYYNIAVAAAEGRDYEQAREALNKVLVINEDFANQSAAVAYNMGAIFSKCRDTKLAGVMLNTCLSLDPSHKDAQSLLVAI